MTTHQRLVRDGLDRVRSAVSSIDREWKQVNRQVSRRRKAIERQTQRQMTRFVSQLQRNPWLSRAQTLAGDAQRQIEAGIGTVLGSLRIASRSDLERIDRQLARIARRLHEIEKKEASASH